jgi:FkbM family methyltransferase
MYRFLSKIEKIAATALGKGYGALSIQKETDMLKKFLIAPKLAIDIGGNIGEYSAKLRSNFSEMEIHIFEPSVTNQQKLNEKFDADPAIFICPYALSDTNGHQQLFSDTPGSGLGSLNKRRLDHFNITFNVSEPVETLRFEDYWEKTLMRKNIDVAKMDVEGYELAVLKGFGKAIFKTKVIQFEFGGCNIDTRTFFQDFWYFFKEHNFKMYRITPLGLQEITRYQESHETFLTTNYLCINEKLA